MRAARWRFLGSYRTDANRGAGIGYFFLAEAGFLFAFVAARSLKDGHFWLELKCLWEFGLLIASLCCLVKLYFPPASPTSLGPSTIPLSRIASFLDFFS